MAPVVAALEGLLEQARMGDLRAIAYVTVRRGGSIGTSWQQPDDGAEQGRLGAGILTLAGRYGRAGLGAG